MKHKIFNTWISTGTFRAFVEQVFALTETGRSSYICFANVHMLRESYINPAFNKVLNQADMVTPDGRPLSLFLRFFNRVKQERVAGMDLLPALIEEACHRNKSVYFYGSTPEALEKIQEKIQQEYPALKVAGMYSPPFRPLTAEEDQEVVNMINEASPDLLFVSLGCPKQENWMADHQGRVNSCMLGLGQAFLTFCGLEKRLPYFARQLALEWVYRLWLEPRRLWKRFLVANSWFVWKCFKLMISRVLGRSSQPAS